MSSEQYTRCPHCKATFQVSENQLSAAGGKVRCGACMEVFDALAYLITEQEPKDSTTQAPESTATNTDEDLEDLVFEDSEEEKSQAATQSLFDESQLSDSLKELDSNTSDMFASESAHHEEVHIEANTDKDEEWASAILNDDSPSSPRDIQLTQTNVAKKSSNQESPIADPIIKADQNGSPKNIDLYYEEPTALAKRSVVGRLFISIGCLALALILAAQIAFFQYEKISHIPVVKQGFELACKHIGCKLPELIDLKAIKSSNLVVRSHPLIANTLIIDVVLTNEADFDQAYPRLALYFSDINGKTVAQQIIEPEQYLNSSDLTKLLMQRDKAIHIALEVSDPGRQAVNYKIRFFPNKQDTNSP